MDGSELLAWVERTAVASAVREGVWLYPAIETTHIIALATLFGSIGLLDTRILGAARRLPLDALATHALRAAYGAFPAIVATGLLMFAADASALAANPAFQVKMVLVPLAVANGIFFELTLFRRIRAAPNDEVPLRAKVFAAASLALWVAVIVCGRLIAYV
jgi:hypothetical protein